MNKAKVIFCFVFLNCLFVLLASSASATQYYVDNVGGNDANSGTSTSMAWKTIARVNSKMSQLVAGDIVSFKRGGTWTDMLTISKSGVSGNPITFNAYGTGNKPIIRNPDTTAGRKKAIYLTASYIVIDGFMIRDTVDRGIDVTGNYNVMRNLEITNVGDGVDVQGTHNLVTHNYIHDLIMVKNTPTPTYDDYGATGIFLKNTDNEVSYNIIEDCRAESYDYGWDGGTVEIFGDGSRSYVHNNWGSHCQGFFEVGASGNPTVSDVRVEYNISLDNGRFTGIRNGTNYPVTLSNFKVQNNTIVETASSPITSKYASLDFDAAGTAGQYIFRNNILYLDGWNRVAGNWTTFTHDHNLFYLINGTQLNITKHPTEITGSNPQFVSLPTGDLHIVLNSPAKDKGVALGYSGTVDFDDNPVPFGPAADIGADEYSGAGTSLSANANGSPTSGQVPLTVNFTGSASGGTPPYSYSWTFGDGGSSTAQNPSHTYSTAGTYTATLTVRDNVSATASKSLSITATATAPPLTANASASPTSGQAPLTVSFTGSASGGSSPYSYSWTFGDGGTSTSQNPSHTYSSAGTYTATLTVKDSTNATNSKSLTITATATSPPLTANASASPTSGQAPLTVSFTGSATGGTSPYSYSWTFGDGGTSTSQNPSYSYLSNGDYTANLTVTDLNFANASATVNITVGDTGSTADLSLTAETGAPAPGEGGTTNPSPGNHSYSIGSTVSVESIANTDYRFSKWAGDITETSMFSATSALTMNNDKSLSATFCTKCGDVNGDLKISPGDAQMAFDIYLGRIANPTWCELENADVNCSGTKLSPKITPADAQMIFNKFLKKGTASSDCSGNSRTAAVSANTAGFINANLTIDHMAFTPDLDIVIPIIIECPSEVTAFGFDLSFPSNVLTFIRLESTELTNGYDQLDASVRPYQPIDQVPVNVEPAETLVLRVGGYKTNPNQSPSSGVLVTLIFRGTGEFIDPDATSIIAAYDDLQNALVINRMISRQDNSQIRENKRQAKNVKRILPDKKSDL